MVVLCPSVRQLFPASKITRELLRNLGRPNNIDFKVLALCHSKVCISYPDFLTLQI